MKNQKLAQFKLLPLALALSATAISGTASAHETGAMILRGGAVMVAPNDSSNELNVSTGGIGDIATGRVGVDNNTQLGITFTYALTDHIGIGVLGATPFKHTIKGTEGLTGFGDLATVKHLPPTVTLQYFPMPADSAIQPYVGAGINYTTFFSEKTTDNMTAAFQYVADAYSTGLTVTDVDMKLDDSVGIAAEAGVDVELAKNLVFNAAIWYAQIDTTATLTGHTQQNVDINAKINVDINPTVYMIGLGYKF